MKLCSKSITSQSLWSSKLFISWEPSSTGEETISWSERKDLERKISLKWLPIYVIANTKVLMDWNQIKSRKLTLLSSKKLSWEIKEQSLSSMRIPRFTKLVYCFLKNSNLATHLSTFSNLKTLTKHFLSWNIHKAWTKNKA